MRIQQRIAAPRVGSLRCLQQSYNPNIDVSCSISCMHSTILLFLCFPYTFQQASKIEIEKTWGPRVSPSAERYLLGYSVIPIFFFLLLFCRLRPHTKSQCLERPSLITCQKQIGMSREVGMHQELSHSKTLVCTLQLPVYTMPLNASKA